MVVPNTFWIQHDKIIDHSKWKAKQKESQAGMGWYPISIHFPQKNAELLASFAHVASDVGETHK